MAISVSTAFKTALSGPVDRSQVKVEAYLSSGFTWDKFFVAPGWVDITAYVEEMSGSGEEISQLSGGASANTLNLTLINDDGRFSPKNTAGPYYGNLTPNKPIRVSSVYGSESVRMFTGYVSNWIPSAKARSCQVTAEDAARILRRKDIVEETVFNDVAPTTGYYLTRVLERAAWLSGLRWDTCNTRSDTSGNVWAYSSHDATSITVNKSAGATRATYTLGGVLVMTLDLVDLLLPCTPLKGKALAVLDQLAKVVDGVVYFDAQGQLVFRSRMYRNDSTLASVETFTVSSLEDVTAQVNFEDSKWAQLCNKATVKSTPWAFKTDTSGAVVEEEIPFKGDLFAKYYFNAGERYPDYVADANASDLWLELPNGVKLFKNAAYPTSANMVLTSVDNADATKKSNGIQFQTSADCPAPGPAVNFPVFEQTRVRVAFKNTGSTAQRIENLSLKAKLMRPIQRCQSVQKNQASIDLYDQRDKEVSNDFIPSSTACKQLAAWLVEDGRQPKDYYTLPVMYGAPWLELGDRITVSETITNTIPTATDAIIRRISWRWTLAAFVFTIEACSPAPDFTASSIPATVVNVETLNQNQNGQQANTIGIPIIDHSGAQVGLNNIPEFVNILNAYRIFSFTGMSAYDVTMGNSTSSDNAALFVVGNGGKVHKIDPFNGSQIATATLTDTGTNIDFYLGTFVSAGRYVWASGNVSGTYRVYLIDAALGAASKKASFVGGQEPKGFVYANSAVWMTRLDQDGLGGYALSLCKFTDLTTAAQTPTVYTITANSSGFKSIGKPVYDGKQYLYIPIYEGSRGKIARIDTSTGAVDKYDLEGAAIDSLAITPTYIWGFSYPNIKRYALSPTGAVSNGTTVTSLNAGALVSFTGRYIIAVDNGQKLAQINPLTGEVLGTYTTLGSSTNHAFDGEAIWIATQAGFLVRVRPVESR